ncbi:hypothetical protein EJ04DRAFT_604772 [Polyplosphaeria fusca]|uniref:Uncharacterized protein n=1 Tax=Polyplosphaeria fusca TaxID=682080 RepID=A0A9P4RAS7_9PLEO|nr:hypothetical protein EJ04DRAFT_604772 [Polyplosphaeria fusca]
MTSNDTRQGWTSSPNGRGTFDILWSCGATIFLCCWSVLCLNVPAAADSSWAKTQRKILIFILTLLGPEAIGITATGQYLSARQSVKDFAAAGYSDWSIQHAFFAEMGGFVLKTPDWKEFPVNAKQLLWLIQRGHVPYIPPTVSSHIDDKNKVDGFMRLIMIVQILWFLVTFIARLAKGLSITALELTTVTFIYCSVPIAFLWRHKPADISRPEVLIAQSKTADILQAGGDEAQKPYRNTPLDFIDREEWHMSIYWSHLRNLLRCIHISSKSWERPLSRISNVKTAKLPETVFFVGAIYIYGFVAIFIGGWNLSLPTHAERTLWRTASLLCLGSLIGAELVTFGAFNVWPRIKSTKKAQDKQAKVGDESEGQLSREERYMSSKSQPRTIWDWFRNNSVGRDPLVDAPLKAILPIYVMVFTYIVARLILVALDFSELRSLPATCYETLEWQQFVPHVG